MKLESNGCVCTLHLIPNTTEVNSRSADTSEQQNVILSLNGQVNSEKEEISSQQELCFSLQKYYNPFQLRGNPSPISCYTSVYNENECMLPT